MEDQRKKTGAGAAGGTLKDEAGGNGEETFGSLMMDDFGTGGKEESERRMAEALSSDYLLSGSQGRNEVSEMLARREGDSEVIADEDGAGRTAYQKRVLEAAKKARAQYFEARETRNAMDMAKYGAMLVRYADALTKEGLNEDPEVLDLIRQEEVEELSIIFDAENAANMLKIQGKMLREIDSAASEEKRDIGNEIDRELGAPDAVPAVYEEEHAGETGDHGRQEIEDAQIEGAATLGQPFAQPEWAGGHLSEGGAAADDAEPPPIPEAVEEDHSEEGRPTNNPLPVADVSDRELEKISAGGIMLTPLGDEEKERIGKLDELSSGELKEMAAKRREQAALILGKDRPKRTEMGKWYVEFMVKLQNAGLDNEESLNAMRVAKMELLQQADQLDMLAAKRYTVASAQTEERKAPIMPARPKPLKASVASGRASDAPRGAAAPNAEVIPSAEDVDGLVEKIAERTEDAFFDTGESGAYTHFTKADGSVDVKRLYEGPAHVMGASGDPAKRRDRTELGMPAVDVSGAAREEKPPENLGGTRIISSGMSGSEGRPTGLGVAGKPSAGDDAKAALSRTNIFGQFDRDPEMAQIAQEGSGALSLSHIQELSGAIPVVADQASRRIPTGQMPAAGNLASLEGTGSVTPGTMSDELKAAQKASREAAAAKPGATVVVAPESIADSGREEKFHGEVAFDQTRLSSIEAALGSAAADGGLKATRNEKPKEDFSVYGDIFYAVEKVYMESTGISAEFNLNSFGKMLPEAIKRAEVLSKIVELKKGETLFATAEEIRVGRLKKFQGDFFEIREGKEEPKKSFLAYTQWLAEKKNEYSSISDVHELLSKALAGDLKVSNKYGVSPGEYNRIAMLRLCNAAIKKGTLTEPEEAKVEKLREMLEPVARGETDIYAQTLAADATYEMIVGFATKQERARTRQLEAELGKYKLTVAEYEEKRDTMVRVLAEALVSVRGTEKDAARMKEKIKKAIMALEPTDALERIKYMKLIRDAQAGEGGEAGKELRGRADKLAAETTDIPPEDAAKADAEAQKIAARGRSAEQRTLEELRNALYNTDPKRKPKPQAARQEKAPKPHGPVSRGIGTAITMAAGAGVLAAGLWLGQHGIITIGTRADATADKPAAAQVEAVAEETADELPAGIVDAGKAAAKKVAVAPENKKDAGVVPDAGLDPAIKAVRALQPVGPQEPADNYTRDKAGLKMALDDWCSQNGAGLLVSKEMLRAAYASVEGGLDGKVLPQDGDWQQMMLKMRFPNRFVELAVMSDIARGSAESDDVKENQGLLAEKYAAYMRLAVILGDRAGNPKSFEASIREANAKGLGLPQLDSESHIGRLEAVKVGERCLFAAYYKTVKATMAQIKEAAFGTGLSAKEFTALVRASLGGIAERVEKLADSSDYQATQESKEGSCEALTGGKRGAAALERAGVVSERWEQSHERAKAKDAKYQESVDDVLGTVPDVKTNAPKSNGKGHKAAKGSPCSGKEGLSLLSCIADQNVKGSKPKADSGEKKGHKAAKSPCEELKGSFYYFKCLDEQKKMPKPKATEAGASSKAPRMFVRY